MAAWRHTLSVKGNGVFDSLRYSSAKLCELYNFSVVLRRSFVNYTTSPLFFGEIS